jgi:hypothetical protein
LGKAIVAAVGIPEAHVDEQKKASDSKKVGENVSGSSESEI